MLSDSDLSEDYDNDPYYQSFVEDFRFLSLSPVQEPNLKTAEEANQEQQVEQTYGLKLDQQQSELPQTEAEVAKPSEEGVDADQDHMEIDGNEENEHEKEVIQQLLIEHGLQKSVDFGLSFLRGNDKYASLSDYIVHESEMRERLKLVRQIDGECEASLPIYNNYFNFQLNTTTWRLLVNKQILMRFERLFIEK